MKGNIVSLQNCMTTVTRALPARHIHERLALGHLEGMVPRAQRTGHPHAADAYAGAADVSRKAAWVLASIDCLVGTQVHPSSDGRPPSFGLRQLQAAGLTGAVTLASCALVGVLAGALVGAGAGAAGFAVGCLHGTSATTAGAAFRSGATHTFAVFMTCALVLSCGPSLIGALAKAAVLAGSVLRFGHRSGVPRAPNARCICEPQQPAGGPLHGSERGDG